MTHLFPVNTALPCTVLFQSFCEFQLWLQASVSEMACVCLGWLLRPGQTPLERQASVEAEGFHFGSLCASTVMTNLYFTCSIKSCLWKPEFTSIICLIYSSDVYLTMFVGVLGRCPTALLFNLTLGVERNPKVILPWRGKLLRGGSTGANIWRLN